MGGLRFRTGVWWMRCRIPSASSWLVRVGAATLLAVGLVWAQADTGKEAPSYLVSEAQALAKARRVVRATSPGGKLTLVRSYLDRSWAIPLSNPPPGAKDAKPQFDERGYCYAFYFADERGEERCEVCVSVVTGLIVRLSYRSYQSPNRDAAEPCTPQEVQTRVLHWFRDIGEPLPTDMRLRGSQRNDPYWALFWKRVSSDSEYPVLLPPSIDLIFDMEKRTVTSYFRQEFPVVRTSLRPSVSREDAIAKARDAVRAYRNVKAGRIGGDPGTLNNVFLQLNHMAGRDGGPPVQALVWGIGFEGRILFLQEQYRQKGGTAPPPKEVWAPSSWMVTVDADTGEVTMCFAGSEFLIDPAVEMPGGWK